MQCIANVSPLGYISILSFVANLDRVIGKDLVPTPAHFTIMKRKPIWQKNSVFLIMLYFLLAEGSWINQKCFGLKTTLYVVASIVSILWGKGNCECCFTDYESSGILLISCNLVFKLGIKS